MMDSSKICFVFAALVLTAIAFSNDVKSEGSSPQIGTNRVSGVPAASEEGGPRNWQIKGVSSAIKFIDFWMLSTHISDHFSSWPFLLECGSGRWLR
jgi:hypothetical protein